MTLSLRYPTSESVRLACRTGEWSGPTTGLAPGWEQANVVILPEEYAFDFLLFCQRNPRACPILDVTDPGQTEPKCAAFGSDIRTDLPKYRVWRHGKMESETNEIGDLWKNDFVTFLLDVRSHLNMRCSPPVSPFVTSSKGATFRCMTRHWNAKAPGGSRDRSLSR